MPHMSSNGLELAEWHLGYVIEFAIDRKGDGARKLGAIAWLLGVRPTSFHSQIPPQGQASRP